MCIKLSGLNKLMQFSLPFITVEMLIYTAKYRICKYGQLRNALMCFIVTFKLKNDNCGIIVCLDWCYCELTAGDALLFLSGKPQITHTEPSSLGLDSDEHNPVKLIRCLLNRTRC